MDTENTYKPREVTISLDEYRELVAANARLKEHQAVLNNQWCSAITERDIYKKICAEHGWSKSDE